MLSKEFGQANQLPVQWQGFQMTALHTSERLCTHQLALTMSLTLALCTHVLMFTAVLTQTYSFAKLIAHSRANVHCSIDTNKHVCKA